MNILITVGIFPPDIGGPAVFVPKIAKHLLNQGHEIQIICLADDLSVDNENQLSVRRIKRSTNLLLRWIKTVFLIIKYGRKSDVVFVLKDGSIIEHDTPENLLKDTTSFFYQLHSLES